MNKILATKPKSMQELVQKAPLLPGCYIYRDKDGEILYIGKAKVLRNRVKSYFSNYKRVEEKIRSMIDQAESIEYYTTDSEIEALILESNLIKKYKPKYNSMQVDDKSYAYVKFDKVTKTKDGVKIQIPTISVVREKPSGKAEYFGPYPDSRVVKRLLWRLRRIFPYCTSKNKVSIPATNSELIDAHGNRPCFNYQIGICNGACAGLITKGEYAQNINSIRSFFKGEKSLLLTKLENQMQRAAKKQEFEQAARLRNMTRDIKYVGSNLRIGQDIDEVLLMQKKQEKRERAVVDLIEKLDFPKEKLDAKKSKQVRIECYDISNIQGKFAVGSMVVFINGQAAPKLYRRFRIRIGEDPNDFAMMQEVLTRRFLQYIRSHTDEYGIELPSQLGSRAKGWKSDESFSQIPNLIIIDGGKGQLSSAYRILQDFRLEDQVPLVGLAKREEEIFKVKAQFTEDQWEEAELGDAHMKITSDKIFSKVRLPRRSESLYLVQRIRDEAHRFAITYHRKLRSKQLEKSIKETMQ